MKREKMGVERRECREESGEKRVEKREWRKESVEKKV